ncbi:hypothetical protein LTR84_009593 [Exophiala bonariae]|uniref:Uncharacterized protein n=1 Tax=Exophiala bonariae TaxID=1690606 RepID=A0AAV9NL96_9EURO|nr:hypothetical protein LTR84_009593 [Exophiala bonariae]
MPFNDIIHANIGVPGQDLHVDGVRKEDDDEKHSHTHLSDNYDELHFPSQNRYGSFAPQRAGNDAKWYIDGCGYFWALSIAVEQAQHSIWIMDWWLSPEVYLRRPPSRFQRYRLDRMLQAAAVRGVKVEIILNNVGNTV